MVRVPINDPEDRCSIPSRVIPKAKKMVLFTSLLNRISKEGNQKAPFSIATTPRCSGRHYSFLWIAPIYL